MLLLFVGGCHWVVGVTSFVYWDPVNVFRLQRHCIMLMMIIIIFILFVVVIIVIKIIKYYTLSDILSPWPPPHTICSHLIRVHEYFLKLFTSFISIQFKQATTTTKNRDSNSPQKSILLFLFINVIIIIAVPPFPSLPTSPVAYGELFWRRHAWYYHNTTFLLMYTYFHPAESGIGFPRMPRCFASTTTSPTNKLVNFPGSGAKKSKTQSKHTVHVLFAFSLTPLQRSV